MGLIELLLVVLVVALMLYLIPVEQRVKQIIGLVLAVIILIWLLGALFPGLDLSLRND